MPMNSEQWTMDSIQNKPNQTQFQNPASSLQAEHDDLKKDQGPVSLPTCLSVRNDYFCSRYCLQLIGPPLGRFGATAHFRLDLPRRILYNTFYRRGEPPEILTRSYTGQRYRVPLTQTIERGGNKNASCSSGSAIGLVGAGRFSAGSDHHVAGLASEQPRLRGSKESLRRRGEAEAGRRGDQDSRFRAAPSGV